MDVDQKDRGAEFITPLGANVLALTALSFHEELSAEFFGTVDCISSDFEIDAKTLLGKNVSVKLLLPEGERFFNAIVTEFHFTGSDGTSANYRAVLKPWTWVMAQRTDCRIFQDMTAPEIIEEVISTAGFAEFFDKKALSDEYAKREYCVQYNESDTNFVYRLMEEEGIASFFVHSDSKHMLTLSDWNDDFEPMSGYETLPFFPEQGQQRAEGEHIYSWHLRNALTSGAHATTDYDFKIPRKDMSVSSSAPDGHTHDEREVYDWPGRFVERADGERYTKLRREMLQSRRERISGRANAKGMSAGHLFTLENFPRANQNRAYLLLSVEHNFRVTDYRSGAAAGQWYECSFTCSDPKLLYRPSRTANRPQIVGPQTALVVGPDGEEIWTDEHGRIKVQFHWDRYGENDENSSCWIRVSQSWAGKAWGGQFIPRIGMEVLVEFLEGDPDRPLCTGAVYNGDNPYPFTLPENKTQSGIRSNSTKDATGANELLFEDMTEMENIFVHAQKDYTERVLNTRTTRVDSHDVRSVGDNEYITVDKASHRHVGNTSINIVGDTGPAATLTCIQAAATLGDTVYSLGKAATLPGTSPGKKTGLVALGIFTGWLAGGIANNYAEFLDPDFHALTAGEDPIADAGRALNVGGQALGDGAKSAPISFGVNVDLIGAADAKIVGGAQIEVVGAFKIDNVGINHVEGIGYNHHAKIGKDQLIQIGNDQDMKIANDRKIHVGKNVEEVYGEDHTLNVGDEQFIKVEKKAQMQVGKEYKILAGEKFLGESKVWEMYSDKSIKMSAPGGFIEITKSGILIRGKKVKIEGKRVDFKKKGGGKGTTCLKGMAKTATPFVK